MIGVGELTCQELVELVTDYLEGALPAPERARFEAHIAACSGCRAYLEQMRQAMRVVSTLCEDDVPQPARQELLQAFRDWKRG